MFSLTDWKKNNKMLIWLRLGDWSGYEQVRTIYMFLILLLFCFDNEDMLSEKKIAGQLLVVGHQLVFDLCSLSVYSKFQQYMLYILIFGRKQDSLSLLSDQRQLFIHN